MSHFQRARELESWMNCQQRQVKHMALPMPQPPATSEKYVEEQMEEVAEVAAATGSARLRWWGQGGGEQRVVGSSDVVCAMDVI